MIEQIKQNLREMYGNDPEVVPTCISVQVHAHRDEIEVKHFPPQNHGNPFTTIRIGNVRNHVSVFVNDREAAMQIRAALDEVIHGWPSLKEEMVRA